MDNDLKTCSCGRTFTESQSSGAWCFRCKLEGLQVNFVGGGGYGRKAFHERTNGEFVADMERGAARAGTTLSKQSTRAELI